MHGALVCLHTSSLPVYQTGAAFTESVKGVNVQLFFSVSLSLCLRDGEGRSARASGRRKGDLSSVVRGFSVCSTSFHSKRAVFTKASHF